MQLPTFLKCSSQHAVLRRARLPPLAKFLDAQISNLGDAKLVHAVQEWQEGKDKGGEPGQLRSTKLHNKFVGTQVYSIQA